MGTTVITFDVDGTLIRTRGTDSNRLHKNGELAGFVLSCGVTHAGVNLDAFAYAWKQVFDLDADIDEIPHHGMTDGLILVKMLEHKGHSKEAAMAALPAMVHAMTEYFEKNRADAGVGLELLPGVADLLKALQARKDVAFGLVTGNLEPIGWGKMAALGILQEFSRPSFGGFGSDFCSGNTTETWRDRAELVRIANKRAAERHASDGIRASYHVGDTPMDVQAAGDAGTHAVGVLTGVHSKDALLAPGVDAIILDNLSNTAEVMKTFGLENLMCK